MKPPLVREIAPPKQRRSTRSMEAMLKAAEQLLARRDFEDIRVSEIAKRAGTSVGSFYARFGDKQRLLHELHERYARQTVAITRQGCTAFIPGRLPVPLMADIVVKTTLGFYRGNRGLLRAVLKASFSDPEFTRRDEAMRRACAEAMSPCLEPRERDPGAWVEPIECGIRVIKSILDHELVYRPAPGRLLATDSPASEEEIARLKRIFLTAFDPGASLQDRSRPQLSRKRLI